MADPEEKVDPGGREDGEEEPPLQRGTAVERKGCSKRRGEKKVDPEDNGRSAWADRWTGGQVDR